MPGHSHVELLLIVSKQNQCYSTGPSCSKLTTSLVNIKISNVNISNMPLFFVKKCEKLMQCLSFCHFFNKIY